jgi:hypothetical protein
VFAREGNDAMNLQPSHRNRLPKASGAHLGLALLLAFAGLLTTAGLNPGNRAAAALPAIPASMRVETSYLLKASLNYGAGTIAAWERISIRNVTTSVIRTINLSVLPRAFGELVSLSGLAVDGRAVSGTWTNNSNLLVSLGRDVAPGGSAVLTLRFSVRATGVIGTSLEGRLSKANGIMQVSHWFPIVSDGHGMRYPGDSQSTRTARKIRLEVTTESTAVKIAAPGRRLSLVDRTHVYEMEYTRDFAFGASPYYRMVSRYVSGVAIGVYYTTGNAYAALDSASAAIARYESTFGEYQWPRYIIAQTGRPASGNEYPGIVFLGGSLFANRETVAHETAHQWWYAMAGNDQMREPWLDEGIAEFTAGHFFGSHHSYSSTRPVNSSVYDFPALPAPTTSTQPDSYDQTIYYKSANFLEGLRVRMGSTRFFGGLRDLFAANRNGVLTTRKFVDTMTRYGASGTYLRQFIAL